ncbi:MAG: hypothetical protein ACQEQG_07800 [Bacillota bacterium]
MRWKDSFTALIFILLLTIFLVSTSAQAESIGGVETWMNRFNGNDVRQIFALDTQELELPSDEFRQFSDEGQEQLFALASRFGEEQYEQEELFTMVRDSQGGTSDLREVLQLNRDEESRIELPLGSGTYVSADFQENTTASLEESLSTVNLSYALNSNTTLRAGFGQRSSSYLSGNNIGSNEEEEALELTNSEEDSTVAAASAEARDSNDLDTERGDTTSPGQDINSGETSQLNQEHYMSQVNELGQLGFSYQPGSNLLFSADYITNNIFTPTVGSSTVFGLEYQDDIGNIRASYQIDNFADMRQTITGLEVDLLELATLSTSYKLFDLEQLEDALEDQGGWEFDVGLDLNVTDTSSLSVGYQLMDSLNSGNGGIADFEQAESNVQASFKIRF